MNASRRQSAWFRGAVLVAALGWFAAAQATRAGFDFDEKGNPFCTGEALVTFKAGLNPLTVRSVMTQAGADPSKTYWFDTFQKFLAKKGKATAAQKALADQLARTAWVKFDERVDVLSFCDKMKANKANVTEATPNHIGELAMVPNDFFYGVQWPLRPISKGVSILNPAARVLNGSVGNFPDAWNIATGAGVKVAILDTGCDLFHGDLTNKIVYAALAPGAGNAMPPGADNPPFTADPTKPWDDVGHGTVVAGIIGAQTRNKKGIAGAAPDANLMIIKITTGASMNPTEAALAAGISLAAANNAHIINMSLHTGISNPLSAPPGNVAVLASIVLAQTLGITCVAAVGNYVPTPVGPPTATYPAPTGGPYPIPPATFLTPTGPVLTAPASFPGVIAVGGHPREADLTTYSWRGRYSYVTPAITVLGPGGIGTTPWHSPDQNTNWSAIFSTWPRYTLPLTPLARPPSGGGIASGRVSRDPADRSRDSYTFMDLTVPSVVIGVNNNGNAGGTSLAAGHVSGATAMLKQKLPWFSPAQMLARHIRFADRADGTAIVNTNLPARFVSSMPDGRLNPFDAIIFPRTAPPGRVQAGNFQLLINPPFNPYIGYGLLDALRLLRGASESPALVNPTNQPPAITKLQPPTGYVRVFPWSPRDHFYTILGSPLSMATNTTGSAYNNNLRAWEYPVPGGAGANFNLILQVIVVDDQANLLNGRNPQVVARVLPTIFTPQSYLVTVPLPSQVTLLDDGLGNDLVANDGIYSGSVTVPGQYSIAPAGVVYPLRIQYLASANGLLPNTNCIIHIRVQ